MADTQPLTPTDAELDELRQANSGKLNFVTFSEFRTIARAVLAKWGTPQPTQAQAGAVPMSPKDAKMLVLRYGDDPLHLVRQVERHHGIKGGQHVGNVD